MTNEIKTLSRESEVRAKDTRKKGLVSSVKSRCASAASWIRPSLAESYFDGF